MRTTSNQRERQLGYADVAFYYLSRGWNPLPLPRGQKSPPPMGYTGQGRKLPSEDDLYYWSSAEGTRGGNVGLTMLNAVGIDIDAYHGGKDTFRTLIKRYGSIHNTYYSTSRSDGSGIHFYRVPDGSRLVGKINGGIEIVQWFHRYAVVWPSIHPEGRQYKWFTPDGSMLSDNPSDLPSRVTDLPWLPEAWLSGLKATAKARTGHGFEGDAEEWFDRLAKGILPLGYKLEVRKAIKELEREGGRYDTMTVMLAKLVGWGANRYPVGQCINDLFDAYVAAVGGERDAESEFDRAFQGAVAKFGGK